MISNLWKNGIFFIINDEIKIPFDKFPIWRTKCIKLEKKYKMKILLMLCSKVMQTLPGNKTFFYVALRSKINIIEDKVYDEFCWKNAMITYQTRALILKCSLHQGKVTLGVLPVKNICWMIWKYFIRYWKSWKTYINIFFGFIRFHHYVENGYGTYAPYDQLTLSNHVNYSSTDKKVALFHQDELMVYFSWYFFHRNTCFFYKHSVFQFEARICLSFL